MSLIGVISPLVCTAARASRPAARMAPALLLAGLLACVSSGKYEDLAKQKEALASERLALKQQLNQARDQNVSLEEMLAQRQQQLSEMQGTYDALVTELQDEVEAGQIQIQKLHDGIRVNLAQDILFPLGSAELDEQGRDVLSRVSGELSKSKYRIEVEGHTDNMPIGESLAKVYPSNWELAGARASRVVRLFEERGVDRDRMKAVSFGELRPVASNDSPAGRAKNRRIEIRLLPQTAEGTLPASLDETPSAS